MFPFVLNTPRRPSLIRVWSLTGKPNTPLTCTWVPLKPVAAETSTTSTSTATTSTEGGLRLCA